MKGSIEDWKKLLLGVDADVAVSNIACRKIVGPSPYDINLNSVRKSDSYFSVLVIYSRFICCTLYKYLYWTVLI